MEFIRSAIQKNNTRNTELPIFNKEKEELRQIVPKENLWGGGIRGLHPNRLMTAWLMEDDPLMVLAGHGYRATEVRDKTFELQQEAATNLKGNRKLPKAKVAEALASIKPNDEQTKLVAGVLYALKQIQTVCFDEEKKTFWCIPEDFRAWSKGYRTLVVDNKCERLLEFVEGFDFGKWITEREKEGWRIEWPISEGSFEEIKAKLADEYSHIIVHSSEMGKKPKKEDYARTLGRCESVRHLCKAF